MSISGLTTGHQTRKDYISSIKSSDNDGSITPNVVTANEPEAFATTVQRTNKSVRFECQSNISSENSGQRIKQSGSSGDSSVSMLSPYPTPLHLTDEMQTPGTVFPAYMNNIAGGTTKIRSQYVYSVLNPIEYQSQWKELDEENSDPNVQRESSKPTDETSLTSTPISNTCKDSLSQKKDRKEELSLSEWIKSHPAYQDGSNGHDGENIHYGRTPGDRPILGMVAAHWNDEEASHISPKWWGGNGIPNSTTKYKEVPLLLQSPSALTSRFCHFLVFFDLLKYPHEIYECHSLQDQKVSWHATPFEVRLEKALSEDTFISQRYVVLMFIYCWKSAYSTVVCISIFSFFLSQEANQWGSLSGI